MSDPAGRIEAIKKRLITLIQNSNEFLTSDSVSAEHDSVDAYVLGDNLPFAVVRFGPSSQIDVYGRQMPSGTGGRMIVQPFTIYLFHSACAESGESRHRYIHQINDDVVDYLDSRRSSEEDDNIIDIYGLRSREVPTQRSRRNLVRMIIDGNLLVLRQDT